MAHLVRSLTVRKPRFSRELHAGRRSQQGFGHICGGKQHSVLVLHRNLFHATAIGRIAVHARVDGIEHLGRRIFGLERANLCVGHIGNGTHRRFSEQSTRPAIARSENRQPEFLECNGPPTANGFAELGNFESRRGNVLIGGNSAFFKVEFIG